MKSEENEYGIDDLYRDKKVAWFGVRNYQARNFMRDKMRKGDSVLFYHSNGKPSGIVGVGKVISEPYPDETQFDKNSKYYFPKAIKEKPIWILVDIGFVKKYTTMLSINEMRNLSHLKNMMLLQPGSRLSITPVSKEDFEYIDTFLSIQG